MALSSIRDPAIKFLVAELDACRLDPCTSSDDVIETYKNNAAIGEQLRGYIATNQPKGNWQTYWNRLKKNYLNKFENLNPSRAAPGPAPTAAIVRQPAECTRATEVLSGGAHSRLLGKSILPLSSCYYPSSPGGPQGCASMQCSRCGSSALRSLFRLR